jgi:signal transduction histidine kinase
MPDGDTVVQVQAGARSGIPGPLRAGVVSGCLLFVAFALAALFLPKSYPLATFSDLLQVGLVAAVTLLSFKNFLHSRSRVRIFWFLIFTGSLLWTISNSIWAIYELWLARPVPDVAIVDILLFVKVVPLTAAIAIAPDRQPAHFRAFGLLDVFVLMIFSLYLFAFGVFAYRLLPGAAGTYNFYFNLADAIGNQILLIATGIAVLRSHGYWRALYRLGFFCSAIYGIASNLSNVAIDTGRYYTGSIYDVPLVASLIGFVWLALAGRTVGLAHSEPQAAAPGDASGPATFLSEHLAMLVALSTPVIGIWLLSNTSSPPQLRFFRIAITLITIFLLTLLLAIKQDILAAGLFQSLQGLSDTYSRIERFKTHLAQSEKLASLGKLVAFAANQIKGCMTLVLQASSRVTSQPAAEPRIRNMAAKIAQYAQRTDVLVDNMRQFAQEMPLRLAPVQVKPILESALHLSRVAKLPHVRVDLTEYGNSPLVQGDSNQLLHVFLQLISNAVDALDESGGGTLDITIRPSSSQLLVEFADSGPGLKEPQRVFEPFYTTKPVGKGTGLGLSTCYGIIQQHNGAISCHSGPQGGAVFSILLPFAAEITAEESRVVGGVLLEGAR